MSLQSEFFTRSEFACRCGCGGDAVDAELLKVLEDIRRHFNRPVNVNSGYRCITHNRRSGGKDSSQHLLGKAADIEVSGVSPGDVRDYLYHKYPDRYGIGAYLDFTHIDVRSNKARW